LPVIGSRRLASQGTVGPMIPFGSSGTGSINGGAVGAATGWADGRRPG
jgi:hypothetical protein